MVREYIGRDSATGTAPHRSSWPLLTSSSPYQTVSVVFDTGSSTLEFASTLCGTACANQVQFDSSKSSTFVDKKTTRYAPRMSF
jgi:hypothetical protein